MHDRTKDTKARLKELAKEVFEDFNSLKHKPDAWVVKNSIPVLFFGDLYAYLKSPIKIITTGLNPSENEFPEKKFEKRFNTDKQIFNNMDAYLKTLTAYFKTNPYCLWFKHWEKFLAYDDGLDASYKYPTKHNRVLHTDLISPVATPGGWTQFAKNKPQEAEDLKKSGKDFWLRLLEILEPDIVLCSVGQPHLEYVFPGVQFEVVKELQYGKKQSKIRYVNYVNYKGINIFCLPADRKPLLGIKDEHFQCIASCIKNKGCTVPD